MQMLPGAMLKPGDAHAKLLAAGPADDVDDDDDLA